MGTLYFLDIGRRKAAIGYKQGLTHLGEGFHVGVESVLLQQVLQCEVHAVVPEVFWVTWQVDTLSVLVCQTQITINS